MTCDTSTGFPTAAQMEAQATNLSVVWREICMLQQAILAASSQCQVGGGQMCTTIGGTTPMTFVSGVSSVTVNSGGIDYYQDSPAIEFVPPVGVTPPVTATATLTTNGGGITAIHMVDGGSGYQPVSSTLAVSSLTGTLADIQPLVNASGNIVGINIVDGGTGYITSDSIVATRAVLPNPGYTNATFAITAVSITGEILSIAILTPGTGYQPSVAEVKIVSTLNPLLPYPLGGGFIGNVLTDALGVITGVVITNIGSGYTVFPPYLVITDPGTGATTSLTLSGTAISTISVLTPGTNYTVSATGTVLNPVTADLPNPPVSPAVVTINVSDNTYGTVPSTYWGVWAGTITNKPIQTQLNAVLSYFKGLGYTITLLSNPLTMNTLLWKICW